MNERNKSNLYLCFSEGTAMSYDDCYDSARNRYYNACSEISSCQNRISDLKRQKQQKINLINKLKTDIKNHQEALEGVSKIIKNDEKLNGKILDVTNKTDQASVNYIGMVSSSDVTNKDLNDVYNEEITNTKSTLNNIFENLKTKKSNLEAKIIDLQNQLRQAESELQDIKDRIVATESDLEDWRRAKTNASYDMEYYRRKMNEDD